MIKDIRIISLKYTIKTKNKHIKDLLKEYDKIFHKINVFKPIEEIKKYNDKINEINKEVNEHIIFFLDNFRDIVNESIKKKKVIDFMDIATHNIKKEIKSSKDLIYKFNGLYDRTKYLSNVYNEKCKRCMSSQLSVLNEKKTVCYECGYIEYKNDSSSDIYNLGTRRSGNLVKKRNDFYRGKGTHQYNKLDHLKNCITKIQGKEKIDISQNDLKKIKQEIKNNKRQFGIKIPNEKFLTRNKLKKIITKLKLKKYKDHIPFIYYIIVGKRYITFTQEEEEKIYNFFKEIMNYIQEYIYSSNSLKRKSFTSYWISLRVIMTHLNFPREKINKIPKLKSKEKMKDIDKMWRVIFNKYGIKYRSMI